MRSLTALFNTQNINLMSNIALSLSMKIREFIFGGEMP